MIVYRENMPQMRRELGGNKGLPLVDEGGSLGRRAQKIRASSMIGDCKEDILSDKLSQGGFPAGLRSLTVASDCNAFRQTEPIDAFERGHLSKRKLGSPLGGGVGDKMFIFGGCMEKLSVGKRGHGAGLQGDGLVLDGDSEAALQCDK